MLDQLFVFVVDDEPMVIRSLTALLKMSRFNVRAFGSAEEFLDSYEREQRGCLLLDVRLPGMSGIELQRHLRAEEIRLPVVLMSGHASNKVREDGTSNGALDFLVKPVSSKRLIDAVNVALASLSKDVP